MATVRFVLVVLLALSSWACQSPSAPSPAEAVGVYSGKPRHWHSGAFVVRLTREGGELRGSACSVDRLAQVHGEVRSRWPRLYVHRTDGSLLFVGQFLSDGSLTGEYVGGGVRFRKESSDSYPLCWP